MQMPWELTLIVVAMLLSMQGCANSPAPIASSCVWLRPIIVDSGYETRLTENEKVQILALDRNIKATCGVKP